MYIKREDAIKAVKRVCHDNRCLSFIEHINKIPSADAVERKRGEWIFHEDWQRDGECAYECSLCGVAYDYTMKFCGNCGAMMKGNDDD